MVTCLSLQVFEILGVQPHLLHTSYLSYEASNVLYYGTITLSTTQENLN